MLRTSTPPTGPRNGASASRSRGGIRKHRSTGPVRVDRDGDLIMDPTAAAKDRKGSGRGRHDGSIASRGHTAGRGTRGGGRAILASQRAQQAIIKGLSTDQVTMVDSHTPRSYASLRVDGLASSKASSNPDGGLEALLGFLERKANGPHPKSSKTVKIKKSHKEGDSVIIFVNPEDMDRFLKLNTYTFASSALTIQACDAKQKSTQHEKKERKEVLSAAAQETQDRLRGFLSSRYDTTLKLLNLSALGRDPLLLEMGFFEGTQTMAKLFPALMVVCDRLFKSAAEKQEAIISVMLSDNDLPNVSLVTSLANTFPDLKNLDLSRNMFADLQSLEGWRYKFRKLEILMLTGNPITTLLPHYQMEILRWFPTLKELNGCPMRTQEELAAPHPKTLKGPKFHDLTAEQQKQQIMERFAAMTGMTPEYSAMCLNETGGDLEKAFAAFSSNKDKLPPSAFVVSADLPV
ncbi:mRNA export factor MEX67 (TAP domain-containing protein) [Phlyctema vagabunda]|uniref:mRNA export factor MEX67 (TAP domain-containing protein) n=1 Tax=Phlyctema vagabunda TaxID=108571 RepID=A0ABR4PPI1_9HELO